MLCYRDRTYCSFSDCDKFGEECSRSLTDQVQADADYWFGRGKGEAPICMFSDKPKCFTKKAKS